MFLALSILCVLAACFDMYVAEVTKQYTRYHTVAAWMLCLASHFFVIAFNL